MFEMPWTSITSVVPVKQHIRRNNLYTLENQHFEPKNEGLVKGWLLLQKECSLSAMYTWAMKKRPCCLGYIGDYTTQLNGGYKKPLQGPLLNNQYSMKSIRVFLA